MPEEINVQVEPSQGGEPSQGDKKHQEGTKEFFQSQYDKTQKQLREQQEAWAKEKDELLKNNQEFKTQLQTVLKEVGEIKNPPAKPEEPPKRPSESIEDAPLKWIEYYDKQRDYDNRVWTQRLGQVEEKFGKTEKQLAEERQTKEQMRNLELVKASFKATAQLEGLSAEEAEAAWMWQSTVNGEDRFKAIAKMFKHSKTNGKSVKEITEERAKLKMDGVPPGAGAGGGAGDTVDTSTFTKSASRKELYAKKGK